MDVDVLIEDDRWKSIDLDGLVARALKEMATVLNLDLAHAEMSVLACDDARIAVLNGDFRKKPQATNVLSWPAADLGPLNAGELPVPPVADAMGTLALGDVAIAYETCAREAHDFGKSLPDHVTHLIVHGSLHLLGYDHDRDLDATLMQGIETKILGKMGLDDPYTI